MFSSIYTSKGNKVFFKQISGRKKYFPLKPGLSKVGFDEQSTDELIVETIIQAIKSNFDYI